MDLHLKDKVVIITGATSGIGEYIAYAFAAEGAIPVIAGRNEKKCQSVAQNILSKGGKCLIVLAELTEDADCKKVIDATLEAYGKIDVLVNNAGVNDGVNITDSPSKFMESIQKNLFHYFAMAHYALPALKKSKGNIINIGSKVANTGQGKTSGYAASKGGVQALTREWAAALLEDGIRVNEVIPAETWTPLYDTWTQTFDKPEEKIKEITSKIPLGKRFTSSEEIANMVIFIASDQSAHTTAQLLYVDGGYTHLDRSLT